MRESNYWLRILEAVSIKIEDKNQLSEQIRESEELKKILGSIDTKTKS